MWYRSYGKRLLDITLSFGLLLLFFPFLLLVSITLIVLYGGSPFFLQSRPGKNGKLFKIIKFKTLTDLSKNTQNETSSFQRLTTIGYFLRKFSIDEIPQLINVLNGDMSLVGPRPLLKEYLPLYNDAQKKRHDISPGITGWAQINGRNEINWNKKFELDLWYVKNYSFFLDLKILIKTIFKVIKDTSRSQKEELTLKRFDGT